MELIEYTSYDAVRAVMGVSSKELPDVTLALALWVEQFERELDDVDGGVGQVQTQYATIKAIALGSRTENQQRFFDIVNALSNYSVAKQLLDPAPLAFPQKITDGRAAVTRFDGEAFTKVREGVMASYAALLKRLKALLQILVPGASVVETPTRTFIVSTGLGTDPVTGV